MATMAYKTFDAVFLVVHGKSNPTDEEWAAYLRYHRDHVAALRISRTLVVTDNGGPNPRQRARMNESLRGLRLTVAVCTDQTIVKGIVTALSWFNPDMKAFARVNIPDALRHLGVAEASFAPIQFEVTRLRATLTA